MNEEKQPEFPDKYHLSRKESVYLLKKNIVQSFQQNKSQALQSLKN